MTINNKIHIFVSNKKFIKSLVIMTIDLEPKLQDLISNVCEVEIEDLSQLLSEEQKLDFWLDLNRLGIKVKIEQIDKVLENMLISFKKVSNNPNTLFSLDKDNMSDFKTILFRRFTDINQSDPIRADLWRLIFLYEDFISHHNS